MAMSRATSAHHSSHASYLWADAPLHAFALAPLDAAGLPYFTRGSDDGSKGCEQAVFFEIPGGIIAEVAHKGPARTHIGLTAWDLCQNTSHGVLPPSGRG